MPRQIPPVDDDIFEALQRLAEPLVDDINSVLRRLLGIEGNASTPQPGGATRTAHVNGSSNPTRHDALAGVQPMAATRGDPKQATARPRAARGTLLPESEYEEPLLQVLAARNGSAPASAVIEAVGEMLADRLTEADRDLLDSGLTRWKNRVQFVRLRLVQAGHLKKDSPRGMWEITRAGLERLNGQSTSS